MIRERTLPGVLRVPATRPMCIDGQRYAPGDLLSIPESYVQVWLRRQRECVMAGPRAKAGAQ